MNFANLLKHTHLTDMVGAYTGVTLNTLNGLYKNYLKPIYDYRGGSEAGFYEEIDKLGVNDFIDRYSRQFRRRLKSKISPCSP